LCAPIFKTATACDVKKSPTHGSTRANHRSARYVRYRSNASLARRLRLGCFTSSSGHQISRTDLLNITAAKSVIERLLRDSRNQTFAVLLHRQDSAHSGRTTSARMVQKAAIHSATSRQIVVFKPVRPGTAAAARRYRSPIHAIASPERRRSMSEQAFLKKQRGLIGLPKSF
jgi:hypothetical protein